MGWDGGPQSPCLDPHLQRGQRDASFEGCTSLQGVQRERPRGGWWLPVPRLLRGDTIAGRCAFVRHDGQCAHSVVLSGDALVEASPPRVRRFGLLHLGCFATGEWSPCEHGSSEIAKQLSKRPSTRALCQVVLKRLDCEHWVRVWATAVLRLEHWMRMVWARQTYAETEPTDGLVWLADDCLALVATRSQVNISIIASLSHTHTLSPAPVSTRRRCWVHLPLAANACGLLCFPS